MRLSFLFLFLFLTNCKKDTSLPHKQEYAIQNLLFPKYNYSELITFVQEKDEKLLLHFFSKQHCSSVKEIDRFYQDQNLLHINIDYLSSDKSYLIPLQKELDAPVVYLNDSDYKAYKAISIDWDGLEEAVFRYKDHSFTLLPIRKNP